MNLRTKHHEATRRAILEALALVVAESGATSFSVQDVADRAGVTHRTVYNHFPTRQALNDGLAVYVEEELARRFDMTEPPETQVGAASLHRVVAPAFAMFEQLDAHLRAYVMLMIASRAPAAVHRDRTARVQEMLERDLGPFPEGTAKLATAGVRMFMSTWTWHLMTEHLGLTTDEAARTASWALAALVTALENEIFPEQEARDEAAHAG